MVGSARTAPSGHRKNLLNSGFKHIGPAVARGRVSRVRVTPEFVN